MSKRLKFHLGEAEMEERSFPNPFPDYEAAASAAGFATGSAEETGRVCPLPTTEDPGLPFHPNGKVSWLPGPGPAVGRVRPPPPMVASGSHALGALTSSAYAPPGIGPAQAAGKRWRGCAFPHETLKQSDGAL